MQRTPAPFGFTENLRGWVVFKEEKGAVFEAWGCEAGGSSIIHETGARASELWSRVAATGGYCVAIPLHWRALPTGIDLQVHLRYPGQDSKEVLAGGLDSALAGGFDSILTMPNTNPFLDNSTALKHALEALKVESAGKWPVEVLFSVAGSVDMKGGAATDIAGLVAAGAVAVTDDGWGVASDTVMEEIFKRCAAAGVPFLQHAEIPGHRGVTPASEFQRREGLPEYPRTAESGMVARDVALLRRVPGARYHVLHISTRDTLKEIEKAKRDGLAITCEVTPHHLFFSNADIPPEAAGALSTGFKMNPPLFDPEDRAALVSALESGLIDFMSTDHAPHEAKNKAQGWKLAPFGTRGLVTALPVLLTLVARGDLSWNRLEEVFSSRARKFIGVSRVAAPSGLLFVDPSAKWVVTEKDLPGISKNSCFLGSELKGRIEIRCEKNGVYRRVEC